MDSASSILMKQLNKLALSYPRSGSWIRFPCELLAPRCSNQKLCQLLLHRIELSVNESEIHFFGLEPPYRRGRDSALCFLTNRMPFALHVGVAPSLVSAQEPCSPGGFDSL